MRLRSLALTAASLLIAASVSAQTTTTVKITSGAIGTAVTSGAAAAGAYPAGTPNFYVSPYAGLMDYNTTTGAGNSVSLNCVDYFHHVSIGDVWTASVTNLSSASTNLSLMANTRYGNLGGSGQYAATLELYKQAAWLTLQYDPNPGAAGSADKTRAIQSAIWTLFNGYTAGAEPWFDGPGTTIYDSAYWVTQSGLAGNKLSTSALKDFAILTDNTDPWASDSKQEFLVHVTPEPGTLLLMITGMVVLFVVMRRRRAAGLEAAA
jgi:hypothetical protein